EPEVVNQLKSLQERIKWSSDYIPEFSEHVQTRMNRNGEVRHLLSLVTPQRLLRLLRCILDETEFLADNGIRSLSRVHEDHPYIFSLDGQELSLTYEPAE